MAETLRDRFTIVLTDAPEDAGPDTFAHVERGDTARTAQEAIALANVRMPPADDSEYICDDKTVWLAPAGNGSWLPSEPGFHAATEFWVLEVADVEC